MKYNLRRGQRRLHELIGETVEWPPLCLMNAFGDADAEPLGESPKRRRQLLVRVVASQEQLGTVVEVVLQAIEIFPQKKVD